jgi:uncharacterized membrane protein YcaP (DUF421 family)
MSIDWNGLLQPGIPVLEKLLRPVLVYLFLIVLLRLSGKRLLAQLNPFDFVVLLILSNTVQNAIIGSDNSFTGGVLGAVSLLLTNAAMVRLLYREQRLETVLEGGPDPLIERGAICAATLRREAITPRELLAAARKQGFESLSEIENAHLEPGGVIAFHRRAETADPAQHDAVMERLDRIERLLRER